MTSRRGIINWDVLARHVCTILQAMAALTVWSVFSYLLIDPLVIQGRMHRLTLSWGATEDMAALYDFLTCMFTLGATLGLAYLLFHWSMGVRENWEARR